MKITKSKLKQLIKEELENVLNEALADKPGWGFLKRDPAQAFRDHVADVQGVKPKKARSGREIAADLGYEEETLDPIEQLAAGGQSTDEVLDVLKQLFDLVPPEDAQRFADEAQSLAQAVGGDEPPGGFSGEGAWKSREPNK